VIDGNDVVAVQHAVAAAAARARAGDGPTVIEALTYRQYGHSRSDPGKYRPKEEVDAWLKRDPLLVLAERLRDRGVEQAAVDKLDTRARDEVAAAVEAAKAAPPPDEATAFTDVWADGGAQWRT
jgi:TPP-dependent pyruvate/acetoin dehydrogenase alpha subunit